ncbi:TPA: hypothetical protein SB486_000330 [Campylobacter jejuni]|nr:hypothetical protein [Campylobacter jejuni]HEG0381831.1 hypothetical protein [Campylobacter jejuni]HEG0400175.1 hypothetical protein [Campylobacter jejuni]HEG0403701.1 hypothetical protein [Campylobacter jejuni]
MIRLILINILFCHYLYALDCQKRLFDISINEKLSIQESLDELAKYCVGGKIKCNHRKIK